MFLYLLATILASIGQKPVQEMFIFIFSYVQHSRASSLTVHFLSITSALFFLNAYANMNTQANFYSFNLF